MSAAIFQAALARLVTDRGFRRQVARAGHRDLPRELSSRERRRLVVLARHRGLEITRKMYVSFRLARLQASVPRTLHILGKQLRAELTRYLECTMPASFYYIDEGRSLLQHLRTRLDCGALALQGLAEMIAHEAAVLDLQDARIRDLVGARHAKSLTRRAHAR